MLKDYSPWWKLGFWAATFANAYFVGTELARGRPLGAAPHVAALALLAFAAWSNWRRTRDNN